MAKRIRPIGNATTARPADKRRRTSSSGAPANKPRPAQPSMKPPSPKSSPSPASSGPLPANVRSERQSERRESILAAALAEFSERGFSAARLDDVARRAGIAKGTIYLYFRDKESLFQDLIRSRLFPLVGTIEHLRNADIPLDMLAGRLIDLFVNEVMATPRRDVIRLMIADGARFPKLAEFYYRELLSRIMDALSELLRRAHQRGEIDADALVRFPQLLAAPGVMAIVWNGLFERFAPLDVRALMQAHLDLILRTGLKSSASSGGPR
jgi:AcrR family transcriptional regulator